MCGGFIGDIIDSVVDIVEDVVDIVVDVVEDVIGWLVPMPEIPDFGELHAEQQAKGILVNKFTANAHIPIIYGTRKVGGNVVFLETSGTDNEFLYMAIVLSEGEIHDISSIHVNDNAVTFDGDLEDNVQRGVSSFDSDFRGDLGDGTTESLITVEPHFGTDTQSASSLLSELNNWDSTHTLSGLAYIALKFKWNPEKFGSLPTVQAIVNG